jgi:hypothetical protein
MGAFHWLNAISQPVEITARLSPGEYLPFKVTRLVVAGTVPASDTPPMNVEVLAMLTWVAVSVVVPVVV